MEKFYRGLLATCLLVLPFLAILWAFNVPQMMSMRLVTQQIVAIIIGLSCAAGLLSFPYTAKVRFFDVLLAIIAAASWFWYAYNFESWMVMMAFRTPDMWIPGALGLLLLAEALRKSMGLVIALLVWVVVLYGFFGDIIPGTLQASVFAPTRTILYLYADSNGVPGLVATVIVTLVLPFMVFGKVMEVVGGLTFFNNLALSLVGKRRGGPAKVAVIASAFFGTLSGSTVANIMSTGVFTIPMMIRMGLKRAQAAAVEAVASNGGQIAPPVMGATAFIMAEFLQVPYSEIVLAAAAPALLYFLVLFLKVDAMAIKGDLSGLEKSEIPSFKDTMKGGWEILISLAFLLYMLFGSGYQPGFSALVASGLMFFIFALKSRFRLDLKKLYAAALSLGSEFFPLILIGGGAGIIIGLMNSTGFAFQLSLALTHIAESFGLFALLLLAALVSIVLGMGMPTAAVYVVLVTVVAPSVIKFGVEPLSAHMFLLYFGLMSMVTPPIAIGSIVASRVAKANMWTTGWLSVRLGLTAYCMPFVWVYNPALLLDGTPLEITIVFSNALVAAWLMKYSVLQSPFRSIPTQAYDAALMLIAVFVLAATPLFGSQSIFAILASVAGIALIFSLAYLRGDALGVKLFPRRSHSA